MTTVLDRASPFDAQAVYLRDWRDMAELVDGPLRGETNGLAVSVDAALRVIVATGQASIAGLLCEATYSRTLTCDPADADLDRIDLVVAGLDFAAHIAYLTILAGTPAVSPVAPTPADDPFNREIPLASVAVASGAVALDAADVTDLRMVAVPVDGAGGLIGRLTVSDDAVVSAAIEELFPGWELDVVLRAGRLYRVSMRGRLLSGGSQTQTIRVRDGGLTGTVLAYGTTPIATAAEGDTFGPLTGVVEAASGLHTLVVTHQPTSSSAQRTLFGEGGAAANGHVKPWLLVRDLGPAFA